MRQLSHITIVYKSCALVKYRYCLPNLMCVSVCPMILYVQCKDVSPFSDTIYNGRDKAMYLVPK